MILDAVTFIIPLVLLIVLLVSMLKILREYERVKKVVRRPPYVVPVEDQKCSGCNLRVSNDIVSSILVEEKLTACDQCGRVVYIER